MLEHTLGVLGTSQGVSLNSLDRSSHGTNTLLDIGVDQLVNFSDVCGQLLDVIVFFSELH